MVWIPRQRSRPNGNAVGRAEVAITRAQYMIGIYAEILAMDKAIMERIRQLIVRQSDNGDHEPDLTSLRLIQAQLDSHRPISLQRVDWLITTMPAMPAT